MSKSLPWESPSSSAPVGGESERAELNSPPTTPVPPPEPVEEIKETISEAAETIADAVSDAAPTIVAAQVSGTDFVVSTTTMSGQKLKIADAKSRAYRTLLQNLGVDILVALATVLPMAINFNFTDTGAWLIFATSLAKTVVAVFVSYVSRLTVEPVIPTPMETPSGAIVQPPPRDPRAES